MTGPATWAVGDVVGALEVEPISRTTLALFAGGSGDHNSIHLDIDLARAAGMDDVFAQGMLSAAYIGRVLTDAAPQAQLRSLTTRFVAITPVGAAPRCEAVVVERTATDVRIAITVVLADGTQTLAGEATYSLEGAHA